MKRLSMLMVVGSLFVFAGCEKKASEAKVEGPVPTNAPEATAKAAESAAAQPEIADSDLSTPADFEEAAEKEISKANYKEELAALEAEIEKE